MFRFIFVTMLLALNANASDYWDQVFDNTQRARVGEYSINAPISGPVTSNFGMRFHPIHEVNKLHRGVDYAAKYGQPFYSANSGVVTHAGEMGDLGITVAISHKNGLTSRYAHASKLFVRKGDYVEKGDLIGYVGDTGLVTGPHLHFELIKDGNHIDPFTISSNPFSIDDSQPFESILTASQKALLKSEISIVDICTSNIECFSGTRTITPKNTQTTWSIAKDIVSGTDYSVYQALAALKLLNPLMFINGDINLRAEGELVLPDTKILKHIDTEISKNEFYKGRDNRITYQF